MLNRFRIFVLCAAGCGFFLAGCGQNTEVGTIQISPATQSLAAGQTAQFTAIGIIPHGKHPSTTQDVTSVVTWSSNATAIATVSASGLATAVSAGSATITASMPGIPAASATVTVTGGGGGGGGTNSDIVSLTVIPGSQAVAGPQQTAQFIAIGTSSSGGTIDLTHQATWGSSAVQIATVGANTGLATGVGQGTTTLTAVYTNADKSVATGTATFQVMGASEPVTALTVYPNSQSTTALGQQTQFFVLGTQGSSGLQFDVSNKAVWTSSNTAVATIGTAGNGTPGLATSVGSGTTTITVTYTNPDSSKIVATAAYTANIGAATEELLSINIVPGDTTVSNQGMTGQYLAFGNFSTSPLVRDITNEVTWISLLPEVASINSGGTPGEIAGLATAEGYTGSTVIYAEDTKTNKDGTVVLSNAQTFTCKDATAQICIPEVAQPQFATLSVFVEGENTFVPNMQNIGPDNLPFGEYVTAPSDTGTPNLIHCDSSVASPAGSGGATSQWTTVGGTGGVVCVGTYEVGSTITLTENLPAGSSSFGGWSSGAAETLNCTIETGGTVSNTCSFSDPANPPSGWFCSTTITGVGTSSQTSISSCYRPIPCTPKAGYTNANSPTCTLPLLGNATVGVIFY